MKAGPPIQVAATPQLDAHQRQQRVGRIRVEELAAIVRTAMSLCRARRDEVVVRERSREPDDAAHAVGTTSSPIDARPGEMSAIGQQARFREYGFAVCSRCTNLRRKRQRPKDTWVLHLCK
jgi:hypothetical protein